MKSQESQTKSSKYFRRKFTAQINVINVVPSSAQPDASLYMPGHTASSNIFVCIVCIHALSHRKLNIISNQLKKIKNLRDQRDKFHEKATALWIACEREGNRGELNWKWWNSSIVQNTHDWCFSFCLSDNFCCCLFCCSFRVEAYHVDLCVIINTWKKGYIAWWIHD